MPFGVDTAPSARYGRFVMVICRLAAATCVTAIAVPIVALCEMEGRYVWPLVEHERITAGFCDYRTRHYHGGIDISTDGREGLPVRAADSGWVMRVATSYWGFGKVVYVQLAGGGIAVYGHLSELAPAIREYVEDEQYKSKRYQQNLFLAAERLPIKRGEFIGKTGQTGAGPPHLHFELRTDGNRPVNPLVTAFPVNDRLPPTIKSITVVPRQTSELGIATSTVDGSLAPRTYDLVQSKGRLRLATTPIVTGTVGIAVLAQDQIEPGSGIVSPHSLRLRVNDVLICELRYDSINYDHTRRIDLERFYDPSPGFDTRPANMFRRGNNVLWHYTQALDDGWLVSGKDLVPETNRVRVEAVDAAGNAAAAEFDLLASDQVANSEGNQQRSSDVTWLEPMWNGLIVHCRGGADDSVVCSVDPDQERRLNCWQSGANDWTCWLPPLEGVDTLWLRSGSGKPRAVSVGWDAIDAGKGGILTSDDGSARITIDSDALYESAFFRLTTQSKRPENPATASPQYEFAPENFPLAHDVRLSIERPRGSTAMNELAIYRRIERSWSFIGNQHDADAGSVEADVPATGTYALLADVTPPSITNVKPGRGEITRQKRPVIRFDLSDDLSGIGSDEDLRLTIDGEWAPVEYDPELGTAKARPRWELSNGEHKVDILAKDRCGNEAKFGRVLRIVK